MDCLLQYDLILTKYIVKGPISKEGHILRYWTLGPQYISWAAHTQPLIARHLLAHKDLTFSILKAFPRSLSFTYGIYCLSQPIYAKLYCKLLALDSLLECHVL
jgi:hypothetical protein